MRAAADAAPPRAAAPARPGAVDAETLRQRWPDILEAVKGERRVAWMLLNAASVDSLEGGVLIVAFAGEGQAKGFTANGHDQVLTGVLATMLGLKVRVRAAVGAGTGGSRSGPAGPAQHAGTRGPAAAPAGAMDGPDDSAAGPGAPGGPGAMPGGTGTTPERSAPGGGAGAGDGAAGRRASARRPPEPRAAGRTASPASPPAAGDIEEEWPDDAGPAESPGPTGMELIERRLGGTIIEEIDEP